MANLDAFTWLVVAVQLLAAAGIVVFWSTAGRAAFDEPWRPPGFAQHERAFPLPDLVTASLLATSAVLAMYGFALARSLALVAGGMLLFLGLIDFAYMRQNDLFRPEHDGRMHLAIVVTVLAVAALVLVRWL